MLDFKFNIPTQVYFGVDSINQLGAIAGNYGKKALIVTGGKSSKKTGLIDKVSELLKEKELSFVIFDKVTPNPLASTVQEGIELVKMENCDFIIGLGGGSPIDAAKAIAACSASGGTITDYFPGGVYSARGFTASLPLIAITTTAGTGTEINKVAVITDADTKRKIGVKSTYLYPSAAIVDPKVMVTLPPKATATTGIDAFFHAMESYLSRNANPFSEIFSIEAMKVIADNLESAIKDGSNIEARYAMAWANTMAGVALDNGGAIAIHGTAHPVGAYYNAVHGEILSATAPTYCKHYYKNSVEKFARISEILGCKEEGLTTEERASKAGDYLEKFLERIDMRLSLKDLGVTEDMIETLTKNAMETMTGAIGNTPGTMGYDDMYKLFKESIG